MVNNDRKIVTTVKLSKSMRDKINVFCKQMEVERGERYTMGHFIRDAVRQKIDEPGGYYGDRKDR